MADEKMEYILKIKKRPVWLWALYFVYLCWICFWMEISIGSFAEGEPKASWIGIIVILISVAIPIVLGLILKDKKKS